MVTTPHKDPQSVPTREAVRGRRLAIASLVAVAVNVPWLVVSWLVGTAAMALVGAQEGRLLTEYGAAGWVAWVSMLAFMAVPSVVGVVLGARARHHGERGLSTAGIVLNAVVGIGLVVMSALQVVIG